MTTALVCARCAVFVLALGNSIDAASDLIIFATPGSDRKQVRVPVARIAILWGVFYALCQIN